MAGKLAPALQALLVRSIDYAGLFPPASLPLDKVLRNYRQYQESEYTWMLGRLIIPASQIDFVPAVLDGNLACLSESDCERSSAIESKTLLKTSKPTYCEAGIDQLDDVKRAGSYAKIRTGGITPGAIPPVEAVAEFIVQCAKLRLPFKATAGLHHPIRSMQPLSDQDRSARAVLHGFVNLLMASAFAFRGEQNVAAVLAETDPQEFRFDDRARWRDRSLSTTEIARARQDLIHSFGSCSFEEPIHDLEMLGWL